MGFKFNPFTGTFDLVNSAETPTDSFSTMQTPLGTSPVATSPSDILTFTSSDSSITITGNSITDTIDFKVGAVLKIPQLTADPVSPAAEDSWILYTAAMGGGSPIGMLLSLTTAAVGSDTYQFSYKTAEGPIKRVELT